MKYYSDLTGDFYMTQEDCEKAEKIFQERKAKEEAEAAQKSANRKAAAKKVEEAHEALLKARKEYQKELSDFCKEYGYYHLTLNGNDISKWFDEFDPWPCWL